MAVTLSFLRDNLLQMARQRSETVSKKDTPLLVNQPQVLRGSVYQVIPHNALEESLPAVVPSAL